MADSKPQTNQAISAAAYEACVIDQTREVYILCLYIAGLSPRSTLAIERIRAICNRYLPGRHELTIVDLYLQPELAREAQIVVAPTLIKHCPGPMRLFIGDMVDEQRILRGLCLAS
jgi:circadian clock protein KaiB